MERTGAESLRVCMDGPEGLHGCDEASVLTILKVDADVVKHMRSIPHTRSFLFFWTNLIGGPDK